METRPSERHAAFLRTQQVIWLAIPVGALMFAAVVLFALRPETLAAEAQREWYFYAAALVSVVAILAGFALQRRVSDRMASAATDAEALAAMQTLGLVSIAVMEGSALFAVVMVVLTGETVHLAFVVPFLAFVALFFPTAERFNGRMGQRR